jgi:hypothetical protein
VYDTTTFLNVDLDVVSAEDLAPLAEALAPRLDALHVGRVGRWYRASFELRRQPRTPDVAIRRIVAAIDELPPRARTRWRRATRRDFNVGIQAALQPHARELPIEPATIALVARARARIVVTVYGASLAAT